MSHQSQQRIEYLDWLSRYPGALERCHETNEDNDHK